jgi:hypothetical protein
MPCGDPMNTCQFCGITYHAVYGHVCVPRPQPPRIYGDRYGTYGWNTYHTDQRMTWGYGPIGSNENDFLIHIEKDVLGYKMELLQGKVSLAKIECCESGYGHCLEALKNVAAGVQPPLELKHDRL